MVSNDDRLVEKAARLRNEAEAERQARKEHNEKWHRIRARLYKTILGVPVFVAAGLLIFLIVDKLWTYFN
jgi:hypothetical protein